MQDYNEVVDDRNVVVQQSVATMLEQGHYESAISYMTQRLEAAEQSAELDQSQSQLYYDLGCAYIIFWLPFVWSKQRKRKVALLQHVDYLQRNHHRLRSILATTTTTVGTRDPLRRICLSNKNGMIGNFQHRRSARRRRRKSPPKQAHHAACTPAKHNRSLAFHKQHSTNSESTIFRRHR